MTRRQGRKCFGLVLTISALQSAMAAELLQNISDDSVNISIQAEPIDQADRRFSYRVICSPDDQALPDCMPALASDNNDGKPTMELPVPDFPAHVADIDSDENEVVSTPVVERAKPRTKASKKQLKKTVKNSAKKATKKRRKK